LIVKNFGINIQSFVNWASSDFPDLERRAGKHFGLKEIFIFALTIACHSEFGCTQSGRVKHYLTSGEAKLIEAEILIQIEAIWANSN
jgi:hypothetical protein